VDVEPGEPLLIKRRLRADGGSRAFINDQPVGVALLREISRNLVELHGSMTIAVWSMRAAIAPYSIGTPMPMSAKSRPPGPAGPGRKRNWQPPVRRSRLHARTRNC
jgi:hypothetical protein